MQNPESNAKKTILEYLITFGACLTVSFILAVIFGLFRDWESIKAAGSTWNFKDEYSKNLFVIINATFVVGILTACFGGLVAMANGGAFEMLVYGVRRFISLFQKDPNKIRFKTFYDYHVYHSEKPKPEFLFLILVGLFYVGVSLILVVFYMNYMY